MYLSVDQVIHHPSSIYHVSIYRSFQATSGLTSIYKSIHPSIHFSGLMTKTQIFIMITHPSLQHVSTSQEQRPARTLFQCSLEEIRCVFREFYQSVFLSVYNHLNPLPLCPNTSTDLSPVLSSSHAALLYRLAVHCVISQHGSHDCCWCCCCCWRAEVHSPGGLQGAVWATHKSSRGSRVTAVQCVCENVSRL